MQSVNANSFHLHKAKIMSATLSLPDHFEVIVLGTGLVESCVAAAAARLGHTVLHIDTAGYYGGDFASFTLDGLGKWIQTESDDKGEETSSENEVPVDLQDGEEMLELGHTPTIRDIRETWSCQDRKDTPCSEPISNQEIDESSVTNQGTDHNDVTVQDDGDVINKGKEIDDATKSKREDAKEQSEWTKEKLMKESRRFNIDLTPRLLYCRGSMVELLISSNISRYTEFKSITRVLTQIDGRLEHVPSSRSDVFGTKHLSVVEKRILMKFLSYCISEEEEEILNSAANKSFRDFLRHEKLTDNLIHFVIHSIAMVKPDADASLGLSQTKKFLDSLGRFGSTPFLWSMYGSGELPQAFCRLCAVFGGVYYLGRGMNKIIVKDGKCTGIVTEQKRINCDFLVVPDKHIPQSIIPDNLNTVSTQRCVYITDKSVLSADKEQITLLSLPAEEPVHVIEVGPGTAACPKGLHVVHASSKDVGQDIDRAVRELLPAESIRYSLTFKQMTRVGDVTSSLNNVYRACGPMPELDFDTSIQQGQDIYKLMYPDDEFLPRAPDPEEIIIGDEAEDNQNRTEDKGNEQDTKDESTDRDMESAEKEVKDKDEAETRQKENAGDVESS